MIDTLANYMTTREAAKEIGIEYATLMSRIRKGKIKAEIVVRDKLIHISEVKRVKREQHVANKSLEKTTR